MSRYVLPLLLVVGLLLGATATAHAQVFNSTINNVAVPDAPNAGIENAIGVVGVGTIARSMRVTLNLTHTWDSDLQIYLLPPNVNWPGTRTAGSVAAALAAGAIDLSTGNGGSGDNYTNTILTIAGDNFDNPPPRPSIAGQAAPFTNTFLAEGQLVWAAFYGESPNGSWRIVVFDTVGADVGTLLNWRIEFGAGAVGPEIHVKRRPAGLAPINIVDGAIDNNGPQVPGAPGKNIDYTVYNLGSTNVLTINAITFGALVNCTCTTTSVPPININPGASANITFNVQATAVGAFSAPVMLANNDANENPFDITISGSGGMTGTFTVDSGGGGQFLTIGAAFDALETNGVVGPTTIQVINGPYASNASHLLTTIPGSSATNTVIVRAQTGRVTITGGAASNALATNCGILLDGASFVTIEGFDFNGNFTANNGLFAVPIAPRTCDTVVFRRNRVFNQLQIGMGLFDGNAAGQPILMKNSRIENCAIYNCRLGGIRNRAAKDCQVNHCTVIVMEPATGATAWAMRHDIGQANREMSVMQNNIFFSTRGSSVYQFDTAHPIQCNGNYWFHASPLTFGGAAMTTISGWRALGNDLNGFLGDPVMQDAFAGDHRLRVGSPAINNGAPGLPVTVDWENENRTGTPDIGADEMVLSTQEIAINDPTNSNANVSRNGTSNVGNLGTTVALSFPYTITNTLGGTLTLTGATPVSVGSFVNCTAIVQAQPASLNLTSGQSTTFTIQITATINGAASCVVTILNNDADEAPFTFTLAGTGVPPAPEIDIQRPAGTSFASGSTDDLGVRPRGVLINLTYRIHNLGSSLLNLLTNPNVALSGITNCAATVTAQPTANTVGIQLFDTFTVQIDPNVVGNFTVTVTISNNDTDEGTYTFNIIGNAGNFGTLSVPASLEFVVSDINAFANGQIVLRNSGVADLTVTSVILRDLTTSWYQNPPTPAYPLVLGIPGSGTDTFTFNFVYAPTVLSGNRTAQLIITSNTGGITGTQTIVNFTGRFEFRSNVSAGGGGCNAAPGSDMSHLWLLGLLLLSLVALRRKM